MSGEGFQFLLLRDDNRSLRERLKAAEKVIEAMRTVRRLSPCVIWCEDDQCLTHHLALPCPVGAIFAAVKDFDARQET